MLSQTFSEDSTIGANVTSCASVEGWTCSSQLQSVGPNAQSKLVDGAALPGFAIVLVGLLVVAVLSVGEFRLQMISSSLFLFCMCVLRRGKAACSLVAR